MNQEEFIAKLQMVYVGDRNAFNEIVGVYDDLKEENERLKNIIYTTLEYVDREEVSSVGTPFTSTSIGKKIKELLEGEKTFNSIWEENQRLNNVLNEIYDDLMFDYKDLNVKKLKLDGLDNSISNLTDSYWLGYIDACEEVFDIINELKESDK